jgi:aspartate/methionine/tyrosine aminotransferase
LELKKRRDYTIKRLNGMHGISCSNPKGAFYAFPKIEHNKYGSDKEFVTELLKETGILTVHGSGFGTQYGTGHFRMVFLPDIPILEQALDKIERFVA